ncbi:tetratricopeptide repeat protein [Cohnella terricola]|uniref:AAA family ATPase n=1 Tax=Cohnella terricola TaxID=1289167 RepID=A0A559J9X1_9BACL|nr:NB-ARC domain-containing protein [Cohnella terricola]TVX96666.1 AAA family ATPase [Cohnella terricola]
MININLGTRIIMFSICTSIEFDLKNYLLSCGSNIKYSPEMISKAKFRNAKIDIENDADMLNQLDLGDYVTIISGNPFDFKTNNEKSQLMVEYFEKVIPVRNRVMHTKPLELGDRAILSEVIEQIDETIHWIEWVQTLETRKIINTDPSRLVVQSYPKVIEFSPQIYHNIPEPEFDDTGYIGRKKEVTEIKELLLNNKNQIITIIGNGGIGKTAITVKTLYDLIEDPRCKFDAIIWISLKTRTLSKGEFVILNNSIKDIPNLYLAGELSAVKEEGQTPKENLLKFMKEFNVLLVLDNLETINNEDINQFIKDIPENSKVLITSRHGIGELEYRYVLQGMSSKDSTTYFRELSKYYGLELYKRTDDQIKEVVNNHLYSNPLSIKWFISGVFNGLSENVLISKKSELVEFCMSNVYNKLSPNSKAILQLFLIEKKELSLGEIDYFSDISDVELRVAINELLYTNMIMLRAGIYTVNDMSRDYLTIYQAPDNKLVTSTFSKRKKLNDILQSIRVENENDPFNPKSMFANLQNDNRKLASYYLTNALERSSKNDWEIAFHFVEKAANISPDYFEVYKIKAFIMAEKTELFGALNNYQIALDKCDTEFERASVLYLFAVFYVIKLTEHTKALELILEAEKICPDEIMILLEKARILMYLGKYNEAEEILAYYSLHREKYNLKTQNILASRFAELFRRKSEKFENRDIDKKRELLFRGVEEIEKLPQIDRRSYLTLISILKEISYLYFDQTSMEFLVEVLKRHFSNIKSINHLNIKRIQEVLLAHKAQIPQELFNSLVPFITDYKAEARKILEKNKGIIVFTKDHFGFIENAHYKSLYFNKKILPEGVEVGDLVEFEIKEYPGGRTYCNSIIKVEIEEEVYES